MRTKIPSPGSGLRSWLPKAQSAGALEGKQALRLQSCLVGLATLIQDKIYIWKSNGAVLTLGRPRRHEATHSQPQALLQTEFLHNLV